MSLQRLPVTALHRESQDTALLVMNLEIGDVASDGGGRLFVKLDAAGGYCEFAPHEIIPRSILSESGVERLRSAGMAGRMIFNNPDAGRAPTNEPEPPQPAQDAAGRFIPPPITGYKPLTPEQLADINSVKALGAIIEAEVVRLERATNAAYMPNGDTTEEHHRRLNAHIQAREHLQTGLMWLCRAIANPGTFA